MKLAEALSLRKDLMKRIAQLQTRIVNNVKVQEGEEPLENPDELMKEMDRCLQELESLIGRINTTNIIATDEAGNSLTRLIAQRDVLTMRIGALRKVFESAGENRTRYSQSEIKMLTVVNVKELGKEIDRQSAQLRELDMKIQAINFSTDLQ